MVSLLSAFIITKRIMPLFIILAVFSYIICPRTSTPGQVTMICLSPCACRQSSILSLNKAFTLPVFFSRCRLGYMDLALSEKAFTVLVRRQPLIGDFNIISFNHTVQIVIAVCVYHFTLKINLSGFTERDKYWPLLPK